MSHRATRLAAVLCLCGSVLAPRALKAQWPPDSLRNLQVLPRTTTVQELVGTMRGFAGALGVRCIHCHVGDNAEDLSSVDFASDERLAKRQAREMLRMVNRINGELLAALPGRSQPPVTVTCATCHHGLERPADLRAILVARVREHGVDSAIALYRRLRDEYYGSWSYDFRDATLWGVAEELARSQTDAALALLDYNLELYPRHVLSLVMIAQIQANLKRDLPAAVETLERARAIEPDNALVSRFLRQLREAMSRPR